MKIKCIKFLKHNVPFMPPAFIYHLTFNHIEIALLISGDEHIASVIHDTLTSSWLITPNSIG